MEIKFKAFMKIKIEKRNSNLLNGIKTKTFYFCNEMLVVLTQLPLNMLFTN